MGRGGYKDIKALKELPNLRVMKLIEPKIPDNNFRLKNYRFLRHK